MVDSLLLGGMGVVPTDTHHAYAAGSVCCCGRESCVLAGLESAPLPTHPEASPVRWQHAILHVQLCLPAQQRPVSTIDVAHSPPPS